ncbi:MAG: hypothetical protein ACP5I1_18335, partial [Candidatus Hinthialibacter sp.]
VYFDDKIDIHHIFPSSWCKKQKGLERKRWNSIINKTAISAKTNRSIGGNAPSKYLPYVQKKAGLDKEGLDIILRSHVIDPDAIWNDDFEAFFRSREESLMKRIEKVIGKPVVRDLTEEPLVNNDSLENVITH